jgi:hypothetical protein
MKKTNPENYSLDHNVAVAIKKLKETGEHHSVFQLSSKNNPIMLVENYLHADELEIYGYYEIWSTKNLTTK